MRDNKQVCEEKVLVIDIKMNRWLIIVLVGMLFIISLLSYLAFTRKDALAVGESLTRIALGGMRQYYLAPGVLGNSSIGNCADGYHFASFWEIADTSNLKYNTTLGYTQPDSGDGPPSVLGWVRTGYISNGSSVPGRANCLLWTTGSVTQYGTVAKLPDSWTSGTADMGVWDLFVNNCHDGAFTWCIED